jgi:hypothetical protein
MMMHKKRVLINFLQLRHMKKNETRIVRFADGFSMKIKRLEFAKEMKRVRK